MHIQVINYQRTFNLGNYASEKIGVEVAINAGEDAKEALQAAKSLVEEYHSENVKKLKEISEFFVVPYDETYSTEKIVPTQSKQTLDEKTKVFIDACKTREELKAWELMSKRNPELLEYYNKKFKSIK
jgi:putative cell wall-binding protein